MLKYLRLSAAVMLVLDGWKWAVEMGMLRRCKDAAGGLWSRLCGVGGGSSQGLRREGGGGGGRGGSGGFISLTSNLVIA